MAEQERTDEAPPQPPERAPDEPPAAEQPREPGQPLAGEPEIEQPAAAAAVAAQAQDATTERPARPARAEAGGEKPARAAEPAGPPTAVVLPQRLPGQPIVTRRRVLQVSFWSALGAMIAGAGACGVDLLYPRGVTGFGGIVNVNPGDVPAPGEKKQIPEGRFWLVNLTEEQGGPGLLALWWKCPHLGCTVPWRPTFVFADPVTGAPKQGWFRCPCHGSTYTDAGVRVFGPAPRSMDTMQLTIDGGRVTVDTGAITNGAPDNPSRAVRT